MVRGLVEALLIAPLLSGCVARPAYTCLLGDECVEGARQGTCEPTGFCAFPDDSCATGRRYAQLAGDGLAGVCVIEPGADPGADAAGAWDARAEDPSAGDAAETEADGHVESIDATVSPPDAAVSPPDASPCFGFPLVGTPCDGADADACQEGTWVCAPGPGGAVVVTCSDTSGNNVEACNNADDDCNGTVDDGAAASCGPGADRCSLGQCLCGDQAACSIGTCYFGRCSPS